MKAMILAAGLGTRLRPLTDTVPKPLLPIAGRPLIVWNLLLLKRHGLTDLIINLHHLGHLIEKELGDGSRFGLRIRYSHETPILGTGGGLKQVEAWLGGDAFLVLNGDTLLELDISELVRWHRARRPLATMVLREDAEARRWGLVEIDQAQQILRINGRGVDRPADVETRMFAGVHVMEPLLLRHVPKGQAFSIIDAYVREIEQGSTILGFTMSGYWSDIGTGERYARAQRDAEAGLIRLEERAKFDVRGATAED
jgi:NDP-sugar pyrophosphorylase family protein